LSENGKININNLDINSLLQSLDENDRRRAIKLLCIDFAPGNLITLQKIAEYDESSEVRFFARKALNIIKNNLLINVTEKVTVAPEEDKIKQFFSGELIDAKEKLGVIEYLVNTKNTDDDIVPGLVKCLDMQDDTAVISALTSAIGKLGGRNEIEKILPYLDHESSRVRANAIEALEYIGDISVYPHILSKLNDNDNRVRANVLMAMKKLGGINILKLIRKMIESNRASLQSSAAYLLQFYPDDENVELLKELLDCKDKNVRNNAVNALFKYKKYGIEKAEETFSGLVAIDQINEETIEDLEFEISRSEKLKKELASGLKNRDHKKRIEAIKNAITLGVTGIGPILLEQLKNEKNVEVIATLVIKLGFIEYRPALITIMKYLKAEDDRIRANAVEAIRYINHKKSLAEIAPLLNDKNNRVRANAIIALKNEKNAGIYASLLEMIGSDNKSTQKSAMYAIMELNKIEYFKFLSGLEQNKYFEFLSELEKSSREEIISTAKKYLNYIKETKNKTTEELEMTGHSASRTFRIFVSSTFSDMKAERNALCEKVYPKLRKMCEREGYKFQAIDLRWGVTDEAALDQQTMKICLDEILRCQKISPKPNFMILIGNRYGWRPLPYEIPAEEFEQIYENAANGKLFEKNIDDEERNIDGKQAADILNEWYRLDENSVPPVYCLLPRRVNIPSEMALEEKEEADKIRRAEAVKWACDEKKLLKIFRSVFADLKISTENKFKYTLSATAQEIVQGALIKKESSDHVFTFIRNIEDIPHDKRAEGFIDLDDKGFYDIEAFNNLELLKKKLIARLSDNIFEYNVNWAELPAKLSKQQFDKISNFGNNLKNKGKKSAVKKLFEKYFYKPFYYVSENRNKDSVYYELQRPETGHNKSRWIKIENRMRSVLREALGWNDITHDHIEKFCDDVRRSLKVIIKERIYYDNHLNPLQKEIIAHEKFGEERAEIFVGRDEIIQSICRYINEKSQSHKPMLISGKGGSGKSALMAMMSQNANKIKNKIDAKIITRYVGATAISSDIRHLLSGICEQIYNEFNFEEQKKLRLQMAGSNSEEIETEFGITVDMRYLPDIFKRFLAKVPENENLVIFIDALDQLQDVEQARELEWLPLCLPNNIRMIVSALPYDKLQKLSGKLGEHNVVEIEEMSINEGEELLNKLLSMVKMKLPDVILPDGNSFDQKRHIISKFEQCPYPLFLKLAFEAARSWRSYTPSEERKLGKNIEEQVAILFDRLSRSHDKMLVEQSLGYIAASKNGLAEDELIDILAYDDHFWLYFLTHAHHDIEKSFSKDNFNDLRQFINKIKSKSDPLSKYINDNLSDNIMDDILKSKFESSKSSDAENRFFYEFNHILKSNFLYDEELFKHVKFDENISGILKETSRSIKFTSLNYWLLEKAYPDEIIKAKRDLPVVVWARLYFELQPYLIERSVDGTALLTFYHRQLQEVAEKKYLQGFEKIRKHTVLANYFAGQPDEFEREIEEKKSKAKHKIPNLRKMSELSYHLTEGRLWERLTKTLTDIVFVSIKCSAGMTHELKEDYKRAFETIDDQNLREELSNEKRHDLKIEKHVEEIAAYAKRCYDISYATQTGNSGNDKLPIVLKSVFPVIEEEVRADVKRINENTNSIDKLKAFSQFINVQSRYLVKYCDTPLFFLQQGYNFASGGPVAIESSRVIEEAKLSGGFLFLSHQKSLPLFNPYPPNIKILEGHTQSVKSLAVAGNGNKIISAGFDKSLHVWDAITGRLNYSLQKEGRKPGHSKNIAAVCVTPDFKIAVSAGYDKKLIVWDAINSSVLHTLEGHSGAVLAVAITPDGSIAVTGGDDKSLGVWDIVSGKLKYMLNGHTGKLLAVSITANGLLAVSAGEDRKIILWDLACGKIMGEFREHQGKINAIAITPDGRVAISGSDDKDNNLKIWDIQAKRCIRTFGVLSGGHTDGVMAVAITPDSKIAVSGGRDNILRFWNIQNGKKLGNFEGHSDHISSVGITCDGRKAFSGGGDKTVKIWDVHKGITSNTIKPHNGIVNSVLIDPACKIAASASCNDLAGGGDISIWDLQNCRISATFTGHSIGVETLCFTGDSNILVSGGLDNTLRIWEIKTGRCIHKLEGHDGRISAAVITRNDALVISGSWDNTIRIWDIKSGKCIHTLIDHKGPVVKIEVLPSNKFFISASYDHTIRVWDILTGKCVNVFEDIMLTQNSFSISQNGEKIFFADTQNKAFLYKIENKSEILSFDNNLCRIEAMAFSPDAEHLITSSSDNVIKIWNIQNNECFKTIQMASCFAIRFFSVWDKKYFVTQNSDNTIRLWDLLSGKCLQIIPFDDAIASLDIKNNLAIVGGNSAIASIFKVKGI